MKLTIAQIDRAIGALEFFGTRNKAVKNGDTTTMVPSPCAFSGPITWDLAENESKLRAAMASHQKAGRALMQKYVSAGADINDPRKPHMPFVAEQAAHSDAEYDIDLILVPESELKIKENEITGTYLSAISFMVKRERPTEVAKAA